MKRLLLLACTMPLIAMDNLEVNKALVFAPSKLGTLSVIKKSHCPSYSIVKDGAEYPVKKYNTDKLLTQLNNDQLEAFLANGRLAVSQTSDGEFVLRANGNLNGGGWLTGQIVGWTVRGVGYVVAPALVVTGVIVAAAPAAPAAVGGAAGTIASTVTAGGSVVGGAVTTTASVAGTVGTVTGTALTNPVATIGTIQAVSTYASWVEAIAKGADAIGTAIPFLP